MSQALYEYGGAGTPVHMAVANGFPPETYTPLLAPLTSQYRVISLPPRPLWGDGSAPDAHVDWRTLADDLLAGLEANHIPPVIGIGHSFGAIASIIAAVRAPARFRALVLLDPTVFPRHMMWGLKTMKALGLQIRMPLVKGALNRRARFADYDEAFAYWRGKRLFSDWSDDALRIYTHSLLREDGSGRYILRWSPAWEAHYYRTIFTSTWAYVAKLPKDLPILVVRGETSNTFFPPAAARLRRLLPHAAYAEISGYGHLFPQAAPLQTQQVIMEWLKKNALERA
jgi:pimeloyl-ACP methyl ester carboxylesterase